MLEYEQYRLQLEGMEKGIITLENKTTGKTYELSCSFTERQIKILKAGGLLAFTKEG